MKIKLYILVVLAITAIIGITVSPSLGDSDSNIDKEYLIKAAFTFNFTKFVEWPNKDTVDSNEPFAFGIVGSSTYAKAFEPIKGKKVGKRNVILKTFGSFEKIKKSIENGQEEGAKELEDLKRCQVLFLCASEERYIAEILKIVDLNPVLTVADTEGFLNSGGTINLITEEGKIRFEINLVAAQKAGLKIKSQLLRLAKRVIE